MGAFLSRKYLCVPQLRLLRARPACGLGWVCLLLTSYVSNPLTAAPTTARHSMAATETSGQEAGAVILTSQHSSAQSDDDSAAETLQILAHGSFILSAADGTRLGFRALPEQPMKSFTEGDIVKALQGKHLTEDQAASLWQLFADLDNAKMTTLPMVAALVMASDTPVARKSLWSELAGLARGDKSVRATSLLGTFEKHRSALLPQMRSIAEAEAANDDLILLMLKSRVFGEDRDESVAEVSGRIPAGVARYIERERGLGDPVPWEYVAYESMIRWKNDRLVPGGRKAPATLPQLDANGASFITIFNCLHELDEGFREVILRGLGPFELFNAVVAGEKELYRLGTSGYRAFLHPAIMNGIAAAGSFEAFVDQALPRGLDEQTSGDVSALAGHRGMVFLRVASSFGMLEEVLVSVHDRDRFLARVMSSLEDPQAFEENSTVLLDILTARTASPAATAFKSALLGKLYAQYHGKQRPAVRRAYGSILSVYQTMTNDRRDSSIDREFALDRSVFDLPYDRLFSVEAGGAVHRMFMRMEETGDGAETFKAFRKLALSMGGTVSEKTHYDVFRFEATGKIIEIYANEPTESGVREGIQHIAAALRGKRVETVIGRGHTSIIAPLQVDAKRVLADQMRSVAAVIVGACGGDAAVRDLISTFGYVPFIATKATGRQAINNAIISSYLSALKSLQPEGRLAVADVLARAVARFQYDGVPDDLRSDANLYQVAMPAVLSAQLFDTHLRRDLETAQRASLD